MCGHDLCPRLFIIAPGYCMSAPLNFLWNCANETPSEQLFKSKIKLFPLCAESLKPCGDGYVFQNPQEDLKPIVLALR